MERKDNYGIQAAHAKRCFLSYDQEKLVEKLKLLADQDHIYVNLLCHPYRIDRKTGDLQRYQDRWVDANSYEEVMTLLDLLCDSREDRYLACRWRSMSDFGLQFHQNLLEDKRDTAAEEFDRDPERLRQVCLAMGGRELPGCDVGFAIELFDGLEIGLQFWRGDEEFRPRLRYLWDENALSYIRYETMYFAVGLLLTRLRQGMDSAFPT